MKRWQECVESKVLRMLMVDILNRGGFRQLWDSIDKDTQCTIIQSWEGIIRKYQKESKR